MAEKQTTKDSTKVLSIFGHTDYRAYLKAYYQFRKDGQRGYSFRMFSKMGGFASPNILKLVIDGERNLSPESVEKFIQALSLAGAMADYFRALVRMNQAKTDAEKTRNYEELIRLIPHAKRRDLNPDTVEYLSHWLYPVLREMVLIAGFEDDPYWIARRLTGRATVKEITQAMQFLVAKGFITKCDDGTYSAKDNMVLSSDEVRSLAICRYHRGMLEQAKESLEDLPMEEREFGALTFLLPQQNVDELKYKIKQFRKDLHTWAMQAGSDAASDSVVQVNFQMYPQTKRPGA